MWGWMGIGRGVDGPVELAVAGGREMNWTSGASADCEGVRYSIVYI